MAIHGDKARTPATGHGAFKGGELKVLVATDIAARAST
jgi:superfamily II DNA/RNA helicase